MENPFVLAMVEFAILGTAGEIAGTLLKKEKLNVVKVIHSAVTWAILGVIIKFMFAGFNGFVDTLTQHHYLPSGKFFSAFFKSFFTNALFGPWIIISHRFLDNLPKFKIPSNGLKGAMLTLLWFWLPAHTVTFMLPHTWQVTLAAVWSFVLGLILGFFANTKSKKSGEPV
ncbi:hypothetical protein OSSY52_12810 [Tepiditoga spiralis]|uniref:Uncharacterized protein n=1 Tax=Tepiditoga spiralis TaxID=2108365 RepID=A0A7G1G3V7_9BACT|nr:hypothetical protein [Tepiditoga spiralis]BBE31140.1 hypothetical protein OSSY52_12810 [Tepiditoga spiralis]